MRPPRLVLKQDTGWFAAGWMFHEAMVTQSDAAFKLFAWLCLNADRYTGRAEVSRAAMARALNRDPDWVSGALEELVANGACVAGAGVVEVADCWWPYQKQGPLSAAGDFVARVRAMLSERACVRCRFGPGDERLARRLHERGVTVGQMERAVLLGCARKYAAMLAAGARTEVTSLAYFEGVIEEVCQTSTPDSYWAYVARQVRDLEGRWTEAVLRAG